MGLNEPLGLVNRFSTIDKGYIITTGNSLVLCNLSNGDLTGAFITTDTSKQVSGYPSGTTWTWQENSSSAVLNIQANSSILYAELIWYGSTNFFGHNLSSYNLEPVSMTTPNGTFNVTPTNMQQHIDSNGNVTFRSADVTNIVSGAGSGQYTVGHISSVNAQQWPSVRCGWALTVVVRNDSQKYRVLRVDTGFVINIHPATVNTTLTNFSTPSSGTVTGRANIVVADGDIPYYDSVRAGANLNSLVLLGNSVSSPNPNPGTSPNNPKNNIFGGVINIADPLDPNVGKLDTRGTFGDRNRDIFTENRNIPSRVKWDITSLDISSGLTTNQTQLIVQCQTPDSSSVYEIVQVSVQVDALAPDINYQFSVDKSKAYVGEIITYSANITNNGTASANNTTYNNPFGNKVSFISGSVVVNGASQPSANPHTGFSIGTISPSQTVTLSYKVKILQRPDDSVQSKLANKPNITYSFNPVSGSTVNGTSLANRVETDVLDLNITKSVDRTFAGLKYTLTYSVVVENLGHASADNIKITSSIPAGTSFISDSVKIDTTSKTGANPADGIVFQSILGKTSTTIIWKVLIDSDPPQVNPIPCVSTIDTQTGVVKTTNTVNTQVNYVDFIKTGTLSQNVDKQYADLDEFLTYTILLTNNGNISANNVKLVDNLPNGTSFKTGSITINGVVNNSSPDNGITMSTINAGETKTIVFKAKVVALPTTNPMPNVCTLSYTCTIDPTYPNALAESFNTNQVTTEVNNAKIISTKTSNKQYVDLSDFLTYSITLENVGNISANNVVFTEQIPDGTSFVNGSVSIGGIGNLSANPSSGINIGTISVNASTIVIFKIKVGNSIPSQNPIQSSSTTNFNHIVDPNNQPISKISTSNIVSTQVNHADLITGNNFYKTINKAYADIGEILTYTITVINTGNVSANNTKVIDQITSGCTFQSGTLTIDGTSNGADPNVGIDLGEVASNQTKIVEFKVKVDSIPSQNPISNVASVNYSYTVDINNANDKNASGNTPAVTSQINHGELLATGNVVKAVDKSFAKVDEILTYNINFKNTGNVSTNNVMLTDILPQDVSFITGSVTINGTVNSSANPSFGINIGSINPNITTILGFKAKVISLPANKLAPNQADFSYNYTVNPAIANGASKSGTTNSISTTIAQPDFKGSTSSNFFKAVDKTYADIGDVVTYTLSIQNTGNTQATNVVLTDIVQPGATFKTGTVVVDGAIKSTDNPNLGINLGTIDVNRTVQVVYKVDITSLPVSSKVENFASLKYNYTLNPVNPNRESGTLNSNTVITIINHAELLAPTNFVTSSDKQFADLNEIVTYTLTIKNTGNVSANNVTVKDIIPTGITYQTGTLTLNGVSNAGDIVSGVNIGSIAKNATSTVSFKAKVISIPNQNPIENKAQITYNYTVDPTVPNGASASGNSNIITTKINNATINSIKSTNKAYADLGEVVTYTVSLSNTGNVNATNVIFKDTPSNGTIFVDNSVTVASLVRPGETPVDGVNIGIIPNGGTVSVSFQIKVEDSIPSQNPIQNTSQTSYDYTVDPGNSPISKISNSNVITTQIKHADLISIGNFTKSVDEDYVDLGAIINFTINVKNSGNTTANNVVVTDTIGNGANYKTGSLTIDGVSKTDNPNTGISLGSIASNQTKVIVFSAEIISLPIQNPINNGASVSYAYTVNPANPNGVVNNGTTNNVTTTVNHADLLSVENAILAVDKAFGKFNEILTYTITLKNTGNADAKDILITDVLQQEISFVSGSVKINDITNSSANPVSGITITKIEANKTTIVSFKVNVKALPSSQVIDNTVNYRYSYIVDPIVLTKITVNGTTNSVQSTIMQPGFTGNESGNGNGTPDAPENFILASNKQYADIGDLVTYTFTMKNSGNVLATNVILKDILPPSAEFKLGTVLVAGASLSSANPNTGINIGNINPNQTIISSFKATVISVPQGNYINNKGALTYNYTLDPTYPNREVGSLDSNSVSTMVTTAKVLGDGNFIKTVDKDYADIGDILTYTVSILNSGSIPANNVIFKDLIPLGVTLEAGSLKINNIANNASLITGVSIGSINPDGTKTVVFKVKVTSVPQENPIKNKSSLDYTYTTDPSNPNNKAGSGESNTVTTQINTSKLISEQTVNKATANLEEIIIYTTKISNIGNITANEVVFTNTIPDGTSFITDSVISGGAIKPGVNPSAGFTIGNINANSSIIVSFKVKVGTTIPSQNPVQNKNTTTFSYLSNPNQPKKIGSVDSNIVSTQIVNANLLGDGDFTISVDKAYADIGYVLTYTIKVRNSGNINANNVVVIDSIPSGSSFKTGTLTINGILINNDPNIGINLDTIAPKQTKIILFKVDVTGIPAENPLSNKASLTYNYTIDPSSPNSGKGNGTSNTVQTQINHADLGPGNIIKSVDKQYAKLGDELTYTISFKNSGNTAVNNIIVKDQLSDELSFISGSVLVNDVSKSNDNLIDGVNIGTVNPNGTSLIKFKVQIISLPSSGSLTNQASFISNYTIDPSNPNSGSIQDNTNPATITVVQAGFGANTTEGSGSNNNFVKTVDKQYADIRDILTYTLTIKNSGNSTATNVILKDNLTNGITFKTGTVIVDGVERTSDDPLTGIILGNVISNQTVVISFKGTVVSIPDGNSITNKGTLTYNYTLNPAYPDGETGTLDSNTVSTMVTNANVLGAGNFVKTVDKAFGGIGDIITYTIIIKNTGIISANNVIFKDPIPQGATYEAGSLKINNVSNSGDLNTGVNIGSINPNETKTVIFKVKIASLPTQNPIKSKSNISYTYTVDPSTPNAKSSSGDSNIVSTQVNSASLTSEQTVNKTAALLNDIITYTTKLTNTGNVAANEILFKNIIPNGITLVDNSLTLNGVLKPGADPNTGFNVGTINSKANATIVFNVKVGNTVPTQNPVQNNSKTTYSFLVESLATKKIGSVDSNIVATQIVNANLLGDGDFLKTVDKAYGDIGYILTYTIKVRNSGNINANNIVVMDPVPVGTAFKAGSLTVNGVLNTGNPNTGINLDTITPKQTKIIVFQVNVTGMPPENPISNQASLIYNYTVDSAKPNGEKGTGLSTSAQTQINHADLSPGNIIKSVDKQYAILGDELTYTISFKNSGNVAVNDVIVKDNLSNELSFIAGSILLNDVAMPNDDIITGVNIGTVDANATSLLKFKANIVALPSDGNLTNQAIFNCKYTIDPTTPNGGNIDSSTNPATIKVIQAGFGTTSVGSDGTSSNDNFIKTVDKQYADIGDILTYTLTIKNSGNTSATNVILKDDLTNGITFKAGTVVVDGADRIADDPNTGILIGTILANQTIVVVFKGTVVSIPDGNTITNKGTLNYNYTLDPAYLDREVGTIDSNTVSTMVTNANILGTGNFVKIVDKAFGGIGDILTYTITLKNSGMISANNIIFKDQVSQGTTYEAGSLKVNNVSNSGDLNTGVNIGSLNPNETKTIMFKVKIVSLPTQNPIKSKSNVSYTYTVDPASPNSKTSSGDSNIVSTQVNTANIFSEQTVNKATANLGDIITYTTKLTNTGNIAANEIVFKNIIPTGITFVDNSLTLNGTLKPGANPSTGFNVGTINAKAIVTIIFNVKVGNTVPIQNPIQNNNNTTFSYLVDSIPTKKTGSSTSNTVGTQIVNANLLGDGDFTKTVDKAYADIGYLLTYTINVRNSGNINANNVVVIDPVPTGTAFKTGSLTVNGVLNNGNPNTGINLDTIAPKQTKIIVFKVQVISVPPENPLSNRANLTYNYTIDSSKPNDGKGSGISNVAQTQINHADLGPGNILNSVDKTFATLGDEITYTISFKNSGNTIVNDVLVTDILSSELSFIAGSVILNDVAMLNENIVAGSNIGSVAPNQTSIIKFKAKVISLPSNGTLTNQATFKCSYTVDPSMPNGSNIENNTNPASITIVQAGFASTSAGGGVETGPSENFVKTVDKQYADIGDVLTYTLTIKNSGNARATNAILKDDLINGITFKQGTVTVDGIDKIADNPNTGILLGNIEASQILVVTFKGTVVSIPDGSYISNKGTLSYNYTLDPAYPDREIGTIDSNIVTTMITNANILGTGNFVKNVDKEFADIGDILTYTVNVTNAGMVVANNVIFKDALPQNLTYETASLKINNISNSSNLTSGVNVGPINPSESKIIVFKAKVVSLPQDGLLKNKGNISYTYTVNPDEPNGKSATGDSNIVTTKVNTAKIISEQTINKQTANLGDIITYTTKLTNIGNVNSNEVVFKDTLPTVLTFLADSLTLDGVLKQGANPITGFTVGSIGAKLNSIVTFKAQIGNSLPNDNPIKNNNKTTFSYLINSLGTKKTGSSDSNTVETQVVNANLLGDGNFIKSVDKAYADIGDLLTYTITVKNTGNITANNVIIIDTVPNGASYKSGTLTINGVSKNDNPNIGINIGEIAPNQIKILVFNVQVNEIPLENPLTNRANITYTYTSDPTKPNDGKGSGTSNSVQTQINHADVLSQGNITKSVDKTFAKVGDELTYTITFKNTGNISIENVIVTDDLSSELSFVSGSILVDNVIRPNDNLLSGVTVGTIASGGTSLVKFKAKINSLPANKNLTNQAKFKCNYTVDPSVPNGVTIDTNTNPVNITVVQAGFGGDINGGTGSINSNFNHTVDKIYADIGEILTYTFNIKNSGNISANNVVLTDITEDGGIFKQGSVQINGINKPFDNPNVGINLGSIYPNQTYTVTFKVTVTTIPSLNRIDNSGKLVFMYTLDPNYPNGESQTLISNKTSTNIVHGEVNSNNALKTANKTETTAGDTITYTISAKNTGNIDLLNVTVKDAMPIGTTFVNGSVLVNGVAKVNENPSLGINIGNISSTSTTNVVFQVKVNEDADLNISNTAELTYNYFVNPSSAPVTGSILTNKVVIQNIKPKIEMTTSSDREGGLPGTIIKYTTIAKNVGRIKVHDLMLSGLISDKLDYLGNVTVNGIQNSGDFRMGINVGDLEVNQSAILTFDAKIKDLNSQSAQNELSITILDDEIAVDNNNQITNQIQGTYSYNVNGVVSAFTNTTNANSILDVQVFNPSVVLEKTCNKKVVKEGDTFIYTIMVTNTGDIDIVEGLLKDNIPTQFNVEEIKVDSQIIQGNIITGLQIGSILIGTTKIVSLTIKALSINPTSPLYVNEVTGDFKIITDPNQSFEIITQTATVQEGITVLKPSLSLTKNVSILYAALGDIITYTLVVKNTGNNDTGNLLLKDVIVQDFLTPELEFVAESLKVDGIECLNINIADGINVGNLDVNDIKTITFKVKTVAFKNAPITNISSVKYTFNLDSNSQDQIATLSSNPVDIIIKNPTLTITKEVDKTTASLNDVLNYTVKIKNTGQLNLINILLKDNIPNITKLIDGSFTIDGRVVNSVELNKGISLKNMNIGDEILIKYSCIVTGMNLSGKAENYITAYFSYVFLDATTGTKEAESNIVTVLVNLNTFKQFTVSEYIDVPVQEPDVKRVNNVRGSVEIIQYNVISTSKITSLEGQELSGYKLIVHGVVKETIEYVANNLTESIHAVNKDVKFSTFIILPSNYDPNNRLELSAVLEKAYANSSDPRNLFSNATVLITAKILSN